MRAYLDTSTIVPMFVQDALQERSKTLLQSEDWPFIVSDLARAEFSAVLGRNVRMRDMTVEEARHSLGLFDDWTASFALSERIEPDDFALADTYLRRFDLSLRTPDALHLAASSRLDATLLTFDRALVGDAERLELPVRTAD